MEEVLQQTYERLVQNAVKLMNDNASPEIAPVSATLSCIGFADGTAQIATAVADAKDTTMMLVMLLSFARTCFEAESSDKAKATLKQIDALLTQAIAHKVGCGEPKTQLH